MFGDLPVVKCGPEQGTKGEVTNSLLLRSRYPIHQQVSSVATATETYMISTHLIKSLLPVAHLDSLRALTKGF